MHRYAVLQTISKAFTCLAISKFCFSIFLQDINECDSNNTCDKNANCSNTVGSFHCICQNGFLADGKNCKGVNGSNYTRLKLVLLLHSSLKKYFGKLKKQLLIIHESGF